MKRGFLNTEKAKRKLAEADSPQGSSADKGKGNAETETSSCTSKMPSDVPLLDLHSLPPILKSGNGKKRLVFRRWLRDPNGKYIVPADIRGKEAGNGLDLWGATLYDFYHVRRIPNSVHGISISTGSRLARIMRSFGELDFARDELEWASHEADPREILAWDPAQATVVHERRVHASSGIAHSINIKESTLPEVRVPEHDTDAQTLDVSQPAPDPIESINGTVEALKDPAPKGCADKQSNGPTDFMNGVRPPSDIGLKSPFHPAHYPSPWPLVPFESPCSPFPLQRAIPIHLLPKKLHVHDPWNLLHTGNFYNAACNKESWSSKTDHIRTYTLSLPPESQEMAEAASKAAAAAEDELTETTILPQQTEGPTEEPAIQVFFPKKPCKPTHVPEAHLYLSPKGKLGTGHHSVVYEADLELPRDLFCESTYCETCLSEQVQASVDQLKESGEWERRLNEGAEKYKGQHSGFHDTATSSPVQTPLRYVGFVKVRFEHEPLRTIDMVTPNALGEVPPLDAPAQGFARVSDPVLRRHVEYDGTVVPIHLNIQWQNPSFPETICAHQAKKKKPVPRTATFRVAAKLSLPGDPHLEREASNYLKFPAHFFQHWNGYNVVPPLHDPTPVGALVPQFFGYYTPDASTRSGHRGYLSPIMLIEHCGTPIRAYKLSMDDRQECAALLFRFHFAGWLHESFAERNILMQERHPTRSPMEDEDQPDERDMPYRRHSYSFRLIDFGRSSEYGHGSNRAVEESEGKCLFGIH